MLLRAHVKLLREHVKLLREHVIVLRAHVKLLRAHVKGITCARKKFAHVKIFFSPCPLRGSVRKFFNKCQQKPETYPSLLSIPKLLYNPQRN